MKPLKKTLETTLYIDGYYRKLTIEYTEFEADPANNAGPEIADIKAFDVYGDKIALSNSEYENILDEINQRRNL